MRYALIALILCVCGAVRGEDAANTTSSVLNHGQPAAVSPTVATVAPAAAPTVVDAQICTNGTCRTERSCRSSCREGLFGRTIEKTREVTRAVVEVPVQVVKAPVRVVRARRGFCCCR
jgi:hypothetical protein